VTQARKLSHIGLKELKWVSQFETLVPDISAIQASRPSQLTRALWSLSGGETQVGNTRGHILLICMISALAREQIGPFYVNCGVKGVPTHSWDLVFTSPEGRVIAVSANVTLKERWKNENLAAWALKKVLPQSSAYIVLHNEDEATTIGNKIVRGEAASIDGRAQIFSPDFDQFLAILKSEHLVARDDLVDRGENHAGLGPVAF